MVELVRMEPATASSTRSSLVSVALLVVAASLLYNVAEGIVSVAAGWLSHSVALEGFGLDSFIETASSVVVGWRLWREWRGHPAEEVERIERTTACVAGGLLLILAGFVLFDSVRRLLGYGERAEESILGMAVTGLSLAVMPVLGWYKLTLSRRLNSRALRAEAYETICCAWLSLATLVGLALNAWQGWWWADPAAGLVLVPLIVREGLEGIRGEGCGCADDECGS